MRRILPALLVLLVCALPAEATSGEYVDVTCPVCGNEFEAWEWHSTNTVAGVDMDGCEHAAGGQVFLKICWTCPRCLYTGLQPHWKDEDKRPVALIERLKKENPLKALDPIDPETKRTTTIRAGVRWDLYLQVLALREADAETMLHGLLRTAWTHRFGSFWPDELDDRLHPIAGTYRRLVRESREKRRNPFYDDVEAALRMEEDAVDEALRLSVPERQHRLLLAAAGYKHRGEDPDAERVLGLLRTRYEELPGPVAKSIEELESRIGWERRYLARAVPFMEGIASAEDLPAENRPWARFRLAELQRKIGAPEEALVSYERVLEAELPAEARAIIEKRVERTKAQIVPGDEPEDD